MRLSQAIRKGAAMTPRAQTTFHDPNTGGTCALGAAAMGSSGTLSQRRLIADFPELKRDVKRCPACNGAVDGILYYLIMHLNDCHGMRREKIADWIERTLEVPKEIQEKDAGDPPPVPAAVVHEMVGLCPAPTNYYALPAHDEVISVRLEGK